MTDAPARGAQPAAPADRTTPDASGASALAPYDALLLLSFGGPEGPQDVLPFLENVTRGRGIPRERLAEVGEHYQAFGGRSPINDQNRALLAALRAELDARGIDTPLAWGNRNWDPYVVDALRDLHDAGARRVLTLVTSAYASYSGCRQYREDLAGALLALAAEGRHLQVDKVRHYFNHPGFVAPTVEHVLSALEELPPAARPGARLVFVTHSVPTAMNETSGPQGGRYEAQHRDVAAEVAGRLQGRLGGPVEWDLVFCSRSGPPSQPWLEPDVNDHLEALHAAGVPGVVVAPIGFVSDHMEVRFDLDTEARATAERLGLPFARAATVGTAPEFVAALVDLVVERATAERAADAAEGSAAGGRTTAPAPGEFVPGALHPPARPAVGALGASHDVCPVGCCPNLRADKPAACGVDWTGAA